MSQLSTHIGQREFQLGHYLKMTNNSRDSPLSSMAIRGRTEECSMSSHFIGLEGFQLFCSCGPADVELQNLYLSIQRRLEFLCDLISLPHPHERVLLKSTSPTP